MAKEKLNAKCEKTEDGKLVCEAKDEEGVCRIERVPDGHGGYTLKSTSGNTVTCDKLERWVQKKSE